MTSNKLLSGYFDGNEINRGYFAGQLYNFVELYDRYNVLANKSEKDYLNSNDLAELLKLKVDMVDALEEQVDDLLKYEENKGAKVLTL